MSSLYDLLPLGSPPCARSSDSIAEADISGSRTASSLSTASLAGMVMDEARMSSPLSVVGDEEADEVEGCSCCWTLDVAGSAVCGAKLGGVSSGIAGRVKCGSR